MRKMTPSLLAALKTYAEGRGYALPVNTLKALRVRGLTNNQKLTEQGLQALKEAGISFSAPPERDLSGGRWEIRGGLWTRIA